VHDNATTGDFSCKEECNSLPTIPIASDLTPDLLQGDLQTSPSTPPSSNNITTTSSITSPTTTPANQSESASDLLWWRESVNLDKANLTLMGFSKGCVVLNQVRNTQNVIYSNSECFN
jgi:hypothetical protein